MGANVCREERAGAIAARSLSVAQALEPSHMWRRRCELQHVHCMLLPSSSPCRRGLLGVLRMRVRCTKSTGSSNSRQTRRLAAS